MLQDKENPHDRANDVRANTQSQKPKTSGDGLTPQERWKRKNRLASWAHSALRSAVKRGLLTRPDRCDRCGTIGRVDAHHDPERYHEPLHVEGWLCRRCHKVAHRKAVDDA